MTTLYTGNASQSTQLKDSQKYAEVVTISMFGPRLNKKKIMKKKGKEEK